jgi:hypothetical protein
MRIAYLSVLIQLHNEWPVLSDPTVTDVSLSDHKSVINDARPYMCRRWMTLSRGYPDQISSTTNRTLNSMLFWSIPYLCRGMISNGRLQS